MKKQLFLLLFLLAVSSLWAKDAYNIKVKLSGYANKEIKLAYYLGDKQYIKQESNTDINGEVVFKGDTALPVGVYMIVFGEKNDYFEFLVEEQFFSLEAAYSTDGTSNKITETLKAEKSAQNTILFDHNRYIQSKREEAETLKKLLGIYEKDPQKKDDAEDINNKLAALDAVVTVYQNDIINDFKGKLLSKLFLAVKRPQIPEEITDQNARFYYYRNHFWDDFDFAFGGLLYSSAYHQRIKEYIDNLTVSQPDSVFQSVDYIIQRSKANKETFKYTLIWALNEYAKTKLVCFDAVYVNIANKYYATGQADWVDKEQLDKIIQNAKSLSKVLCGKKAPDIKAKTESYATPSLNTINAKYMAVFIWDTDCGHCKKQAKELKGIYSAYKDKGFTVYSVNVGDDKEKWQKYSDEEGFGWINLHQSAILTDIKKEYDVKTTPQLFLLDEDKNIVYKRIDVNQLVELLGNLMN